MRRVLVIGSGGAGKTTFAKALGERTGLPVVHLDSHYWKPGWVESPRDEWEATVRRLLAESRWIMDGNYGGTFSSRFPAADTVIFLDRPRLLCIWRVLKRWMSHRGSTRPDLPSGCPERLGLDFLHWIWTYPTRRRHAILQRISGLRPDQSAHVLRTESDVRHFLASATAS